MGNSKRKKLLLWVLLIAVLAVAAVVAVLVCRPGEKAPDNDTTTDGYETYETVETPVVPLPTKYIVLSYPAELQNDVKVTYKDLADGQLITFATDITGEELELFHFSISTSGDDGFPLGVLKDENAGDLVVCFHVEDYTDGNRKPEDFNKINAMQQRVNDIIVQFYDDPRFVSNN